MFRGVFIKMKISKSKFDGIFWIEGEKKKIATINLVEGYAPFGEELVEKYRIWNQYRSKWAAAIMKGIKEFPLRAGDSVLYLGAASGQSASYISDIVGSKGKVFCLEISERTMRDLIFVAEKKTNMIPVLADATQPGTYPYVGQVDFIFQDVAMPNQTEILIKNAKNFLKKGGYAMLALKSRSVDVSANPKDIFKTAEEELKKHFTIVDKKRLEPFEMDHIVFLLKN
jgi:fibrillarin-like pre-rRNA processing protein